MEIDNNYGIVYLVKTYVARYINTVFNIRNTLCQSYLIAQYNEINSFVFLINMLTTLKLLK